VIYEEVEIYSQSFITLAVGGDESSASCFSLKIIKAVPMSLVKLVLTMS
jgi:hypothetical protein